MSTLKTNKLVHTANGASEFTLPTADGSANQLLKTDGSGNLGWATDQGGKLKQIKYAQDTTLVETTSTSYQTYTQLSIDITPTSSSNLIFCQLAVVANVYQNSGTDAHGQIAVTDDNGSSYLFQNEIRFYDYGGSGGFLLVTTGGSHIETAGTTSAKSYKVRFKKIAGSKIVLNNYGTSANINNSFFSIMEIEP